MNILVSILALVAGAIVLLLIIAAFLKKEYTLAREVLIRKPRKHVFEYIRYLKNQDHYNKWLMTDPGMNKSFRGTDGAVGFVYAWDGNKKAGKGEQEIKRIQEGEEIDVELRFEKPFEGIAVARMKTTSAAGDQTLVNWSMSGRNPYPMNVMNLFVRDLLGKDLELSLRNLKTILENQ